MYYRWWKFLYWQTKRCQKERVHITKISINQKFYFFFNYFSIIRKFSTIDDHQIISLISSFSQSMCRMIERNFRVKLGASYYPSWKFLHAKRLPTGNAGNIEDIRVKNNEIIAV